MREIVPESVGRLTEADLEEIARLARENEAETHRGPLLALVDEVRRLRGVVLGDSIGRRGIPVFQAETRG